MKKLICNQLFIYRLPFKCSVKYLLSESNTFLPALVENSDMELENDSQKKWNNKEKSFYLKNSISVCSIFVLITVICKRFIQKIYCGYKMTQEQSEEIVFYCKDSRFVYSIDVLK